MTKRRCRKNRTSPATIAFTLVVCALLTSQTFANENELTFVYLVRHAEKQKGDDPKLTAEGEKRAENYADFFEPAGIQQVFSTDFNRTRQTAQPIAKKTGIQMEIYDPKKLTEFAEQVKANTKTTVIVGHSNTTHQLVKILGGDEGDPIDEPKEYDRVYQLVMRDGKVIHTNVFRSSNR